MLATLTVENVVAGGKGIAFASANGVRRAVLLPLVAPGDVVRADVDFSRSPARGVVLEVIQSSGARVVPPCEIADRCGGCDLMHIAAPARRSALLGMVRDALPPQLQTVAVKEHHLTEELRYRSRARFHIDAKKPPHVHVGFRAAGSHDLASPRECRVLVPALEETRRALAAWLKGASGYGEATLAGTARERVVLDLTFAGELPATFFAALEQALVDARLLGGARVWTQGAKRPATFGSPTPVMVGADGAPLELAPGGFGQASDEGNVLLGRCVAELLAPLPLHGASVVELFAGAGNFTSLLARTGARVTAVEADAEATSAARRNLAARGLDAKIVTADAETYPLRGGAERPRLVFLDPPRTGAKGAAALIAKARPDSVLYVSCDPPTLGRDLGTLLDAGYGVSSIDVFELFPQTSHVETVVLLRHRRTVREPDAGP